MKNVLYSLHSLLKAGGLEQMWMTASRILFTGQLSELLVSSHVCTFETTIRYLLHCSSFSNDRLPIFNKVRNTNENILSKTTTISQNIFSLLTPSSNIKTTLMLRYVNITTYLYSPMFSSMEVEYFFRSSPPEVFL